MKVERLDHVHIYVKDIEKAREEFAQLFETTFDPPGIVETFQMKAYQ